MKKSILILLILFSYKGTFAQNALSETEKLAATAKIWGFLKYYHPDVANGKYNWDEQLFEILPKVKNSTSKGHLSQVYIDWINNLGKVKTCKKCDQEKDQKFFYGNLDLSWIEDTTAFTPELSQKLKFIEQNRHQGRKRYVSSNGRVGNIEIRNEVDYKGSDWQDENLRLLALFRYWNIVEYFYPNKYQTDVKWAEVLNLMIPKFLTPSTETDFHLAMIELIVSTDDSHNGLGTDLTNDYLGRYRIPAKFKLIDNKAVIIHLYNDSLAMLDDIRIGDVMTKIDSKDVGTLFEEKEQYIWGSNITRKKYQAVNTIFNGSSSDVEIEFSRDTKTQVKTVKRYLSKDLNAKWPQSALYKVLDGNIGYVNMGVLKREDVSEVMENLKDTKAIIFDIRNYPNGTYNHIAKYITSSRNDFFRKTYPDLNYPGRYIWENGRQWGNDEDLIFQGKVILLVNESTQSHAEFTTMAFQTGDNVTTIGSQTSGADGNVSTIEMVGGFNTWISGIGIFYPDGTETQRKGMKIDIEVTPTIQGVIEGKDEVLEKAIQFVNNKNTPVNRNKKP
jgi:carboxyl-terminal processing protease